MVQLGREAYRGYFRVVCFVLFNLSVKVRKILQTCKRFANNIPKFIKNIQIFA